MSELVRFGVAMDGSLLAGFDVLAEARGVTRSELLRDLVRAEVAKSDVATGVPAVAALTIVYDHHVRELTERLNEMQHQLGQRVQATMHVHLNANDCLEVIVMKGRSDDLQRIAERLSATRGVRHGAAQIIAITAPDEPPHRRAGHAYEHSHGHAADGSHAVAAARAKPKSKRARSR